MTPYLSAKNKTLGLPINTTIVWYLLLNHLNATDVVWGAFYVLITIMWLVSIVEFMAILAGKKKAIEFDENGRLKIT